MFNIKTSTQGIDMLQKWTTIAVLLTSLFSTIAKAEQSTDCMELYWGPYMGDCTLTLTGVEKLNQFFMANKDIPSLWLWDMHMEDKVSEALVFLLEDNKNITNLYLANTNFAQSELKQLAKNDHLRSLQLYDNNFDDESFLALAANRSIDSLVLGEPSVSLTTVITFLDEHPIKSLGLASLNSTDSDLQELLTKHSTFNSLYLNNIKTHSLKALSLLTNLEELAIQSMHVSDDDMAQIITLKNLKQIDLTDTDITSAGANQLGQLKNLERVYIYNLESETKNKMGIGDEGINFIKELPSLKSLYLSGQHLSKEGALTISQNKNLTDVELPANEIDDEGAILLSSLPNLKELDLTQNDIGDMAAVMIANNNSIHMISLGKNHIGDIGGVALANKANLSRLFLWSNQLTDVTANAFANRTSHMNTLVIYNNQFSEDAIQAMRNNPNIDAISAGMFNEIRNQWGQTRLIYKRALNHRG